MKIIIDLKDRDYELLKNAGITIDFNTLFHGKEKDRELTFSTFNLIESLKNGIPYNSTGDLISRSALKANMKKAEEQADTFEMFVEFYEQIIDNAPTVVPDNDIFEWCTDCKEYDQEKHCCHRWSSKIREVVEEVKQCKLDELRPKGEWIEKEETPASVSYYCSNCKFEGLPITPYCPWCGADMRGEEE